MTRNSGETNDNTTTSSTSTSGNVDNSTTGGGSTTSSTRSTNYRRCGPPYTMRAFTKASKIMNDRKRRANREEETGSKSDKSE